MNWKLLFLCFGMASAGSLGSNRHLVRRDDSEHNNEGVTFGHESSLGDIALTEEQKRNAANSSRYDRDLWPNGRVPYYIDRLSFSMDERNFIEGAIASFNNKVEKVQIIPVTTENDYVEIISGDGCYSYLGKIGGKQVLSLERTGCLTTATVHRQFMFAIGFTHEHTRSDRDNYVQVLWENIPTEYHSQYEKNDDFKIIGEYDYSSVMHYPIYAPVTGKDAFAVPDGIDKNSLGSSNEITDIDIDKINTLYS